MISGFPAAGHMLPLVPERDADLQDSPDPKKHVVQGAWTTHTSTLEQALTSPVVLAYLPSCLKSASRPESCSAFWANGCFRF